MVFAANEFIAACGDSGVTYKFNCDAPSGQLFYYPNLNVKDYPSNNGSPESPLNWNTEQWDKQNATELGYFYHPCNEKHEASTAEGFYWGFTDWYNGIITESGRNNKHDAGETVIVWRGPNGNNGHATTNLNMSTWETARS